MRLDPNMAMFVQATAFITSFLFAIAAFIPTALAIRWLFF
jgi:hypothetical protein